MVTKKGDREMALHCLSERCEEKINAIGHFDMVDYKFYKVGDHVFYRSDNFYIYMLLLVGLEQM